MTSCADTFPLRCGLFNPGTRALSASCTAVKCFQPDAGVPCNRGLLLMHTAPCSQHSSMHAHMHSFDVERSESKFHKMWQCCRRQQHVLPTEYCS